MKQFAGINDDALRAIIDDATRDLASLGYTVVLDENSHVYEQTIPWHLRIFNSYKTITKQGFNTLNDATAQLCHFSEWLQVIRDLRDLIPRLTKLGYSYEVKDALASLYGHEEVRFSRLCLNDELEDEFISGSSTPFINDYPALLDLYAMVCKAETEQILGQNVLLFQALGWTVNKQDDGYTIFLPDGSQKFVAAGNIDCAKLIVSDAKAQKTRAEIKDFSERFATDLDAP